MRGTCHVYPEVFCAQLQVWQLWQVVGPSISRAVHGMPLLLFLFFPDKENGTARTAIAPKRRPFSTAYLWQVAPPQSARTCHIRHCRRVRTERLGSRVALAPIFDPPMTLGCHGTTNLGGSRPLGGDRPRRRGTGDRGDQGTFHRSPWITGPPAVRSKASATTRWTIRARVRALHWLTEGSASRTLWSARGIDNGNADGERRWSRRLSIRAGMLVLA
jgi:hypothetical protein